MPIATRHFTNPAFNALNVLEVEVDRKLIDDLRNFVSDAGIDELEQSGVRQGLRFNVVKPSWKSDIKWVTQGDIKSYRWFEQVFHRLRLSSYVENVIDFDRNIVMYSGFFVTRSKCDGYDFHNDWKNTQGNAFTFLCPVTENCANMGLSYLDRGGEIKEYKYSIGRGIIIGDRFIHSTTPGFLQSRSVILSFTFGTDRMEYWKEISTSVAAQGGFYMRADGRMIRRRSFPMRKVRARWNELVAGIARLAGPRT